MEKEKSMWLYKFKKHNRLYQAKLAKEETRILCESIYLIWENSKITPFTQATTGGKSKHNSINLKYRLRLFQIHETNHGSSSGRGSRKYSIFKCFHPTGKKAKLKREWNLACFLPGPLWRDRKLGKSTAEAKSRKIHASKELGIEGVGGRRQGHRHKIRWGSRKAKRSTVSVSPTGSLGKLCP